MRLLFCGFGGVGRALARMLAARRAGDFRVVGIVTGQHGACFDPAGLDFAALASSFERDGGFSPESRGPVANALEAAAEVDFDVLVEMSPLSVAARGEPAISHCRAALARGRHVVTCNKGPIAWGSVELDELAAEKGVELLCESTVMDGAPVFNLQRHCLRGLRVLEVEGVLNSTTNVALAGMERGLSLNEALVEARRLGVAEADPSLDVDGWDAAVKLSVLAARVLGRTLEPEQVARQSLREVDPARVVSARRHGTPLKMVCRARLEGTGVEASVAAEEVPGTSVLATVTGTSSVLRLHTDLPGSFTIVEEAPTVATTAYGVLADLLSIHPRAKQRR